MSRSNSSSSTARLNIATKLDNWLLGQKIPPRLRACRSNSCKTSKSFALRITPSSYMLPRTSSIQAQFFEIWRRRVPARHHSIWMHHVCKVPPAISNGPLHLLGARLARGTEHSFKFCPRNGSELRHPSHPGILVPPIRMNLVQSKHALRYPAAIALHIHCQVVSKHDPNLFIYIYIYQCLSTSCCKEKPCNWDLMVPKASACLEYARLGLVQSSSVTT